MRGLWTLDERRNACPSSERKRRCPRKSRRRARRGLPDVEVHPGDADWEDLSARLPTLPGARQILDVSVDLVQTSCGMGVPLFDYMEDREAPNEWAERKGADGIRDYWAEKNVVSIDGFSTR